MRPTHCLVYYTAQGRTLKDKSVLLLDTTNKFFTLRHFTVGASRATSGTLLAIATPRQQTDMLNQETVIVEPNPIRFQFGEHDFTL